MDGGRFLKAVYSKCATIFGLGFLAIFVQVAQAQGPLNYFKNYFVTGDYVVGGVGLASVKPTVSGSTISVTDTINFSGVPCTSGPGLSARVVPCTAKGALPGDVIAAFLYWQTIETSSTPTSTAGSFNATPATKTTPANPNPISGLALGNPTISACAASVGSTQTNEYAHFYRADVLRYLPINNTANVRVANGPQTFTLTSTSTSTQFNGATLVVIYRLVTPGNPRIAPLRSVVIYDGAFTGTPSGGLNQTMGGFYQASSDPDAKMTQIVGNGLPGFRSTLTVNGGVPQGVPSDPFVGAQGLSWDNYTFNINLAPNASSVETSVVLNKDCLSWGAIITSTNVQDSDFDGLLDVWETSGLYFDPGTRYDGMTTAPFPAAFGTCLAPPSNARTSCLNLPAMGAKPSVPDIFVQIDWMQYQGSLVTAAGGVAAVPDHVHNPELAALNMVGAVFKSHGINLHFDVGANGPNSICQTGTTIGPCAYQGQGSPYIIPAAYSQGGNVVQESTLLCPNHAQSTCTFPSQSSQYSVLGWKEGFDAVKNGYPALGLPQLFATDRKDTFHYALFGHALAATTPLSAPYAGSISGVGDLPGGDFMVTLGLWRSDNAAVDQVGTELDQAGTLMHELGHTLDLHHGGWNNTPVCMPNYPSSMNYLYQVAGLTDSAGNEHIDYSYGFELPMSEDFLSSAFPMGVQQYKVRYFGPLNTNPSSPLFNTPGQASQVYCTGQLLTGSEGPYVLVQGASVSTPDWSNGTILPLGKTITSGLDINYDGTIGQSFSDSPDWMSLNLQQVGGRSNTNGLSANVELADLGLADLGLADLGLADLGLADLGLADLGLADLGLADLGQVALGDPDQATFHASGGATPPTGLAAAVTTNPPTPPNTNPGGTGNILTWTGGTNEVAYQYNIYRCNSSVAACTPKAAIGNVPLGTPTPTTYTDYVNDYVDAGATCPAASTCYNTNYTYAVTEVPQVVTGSLIKAGAESAKSTPVSSEVNHLFVIGNITPQSIVYGSANPAITVNIYGNSGSPTATCVYTTSPSSTTGITPRNVTATPYSIYCSGPATVSGSPTDGVTYNANYLAFTPSTLTITQYPITITAAASTKTYDGTTSSLSTPLTPSALPYGETLTWMETYDNPNVFTPLATHVMTPAPTASEPSLLSNYNVTYITINTGVINQATPTVTATGATCTYNGSPCAGTGSATGVLSGPDVLTPVTLSYSGVVNGGAVYGPIATAPTNAGAYSVTASYAGSTNYKPGTSTPATITINQATPTVTDGGPTPAAPDYGVPVTLTVTVAPPASGEVPTGTVTFSFTLNSITNYICSNGTFSTSLPACTVPLTYNGSNYVASVTTTSALPTGAENVVATYSGDPNFLGEPANPNPVSVTVSQANSAITLKKSTDPSTYGQSVNLTVEVVDNTGGSIGVPTGTVTLSFQLDPTVQNGQVYYICADGSVITTPPCVNPITLDPDPMNPIGATATVQTSALPAGLATFANPGAKPPTPFSYPINATYSGDTNFAPSGPFGLSQTVNQLPVTATAGSYSGTYDGAPHSPTPACAVTPVAPNTFTGTLTCMNNPSSVGPNAGSGTVTPVPSVAAADSLNNYAITSVPGSWNIAQANAIITVTLYSVTYDGNAHTATGSATGVSGANLTAGLNLSGTTHTNAGTYTGDPWTFTDTSGNYNNASGAVNDVIKQQPVTVNLLNMNPTYSGGPLMPTVTTTPPGIAVSFTGAPDTNAGSYPVAATVTNPNYIGSANGLFVIGQYPLTVTATGVNKDFDGTTNATVTLSDSRVFVDTSISESYTSASFVNAGPRTGITVNVNGISISGAGVGNYSLQNTTATTNANISDTINLSALSLNGKNYGSNTTALPVWTGSALQLTSAGSETASAWLGTAIPVASAFTTTFQFKITPAATGPNAIGDGFAFVIRGASTGATTLGATGYGMYIGYDGIPNSIAIEFDTYENSQYDDPDGPHIGIQSLGAEPNTPDHTPATGAKLVTPVQATFADGNAHTATITYDGVSTISVYLDGSASPIVSGTVKGGLNTFLGLSGGPAYIGFTAATGGAQENSDILTWTWN
ncbi:MAG: MBG domain-containing protein [Bryobacteraceae bacterium]